MYKRTVFQTSHAAVACMQAYTCMFIQTRTRQQISEIASQTPHQSYNRKASHEIPTCTINMYMYSWRGDVTGRRCRRRRPQQFVKPHRYQQSRAAAFLRVMGTRNQKGGNGRSKQDDNLRPAGSQQQQQKQQSNPYQTPTPPPVTLPAPSLAQSLASSQEPSTAVEENAVAKGRFWMGMGTRLWSIYIERQICSCTIKAITSMCSYKLLEMADIPSSQTVTI